MGMFNQCCGTRYGGGGAPPYRKDEEKVIPTIIVKDLEIVRKKISEELYKNITVRLLTDE
jgi:hypothetical protein